MNNKTSLSHRKQEPESSVLYIVGTPIGNLNDFSSRAINILNNVSFIACEDTRQTKKLMNRYKITNYLISFNKHNSFKKIPALIKDLKSGKSIALVSDAGMPGICDPGENLVKCTKLNKIEVICIPGACAAINALLSSGMESSKFIFEGFLPKKKSERSHILDEISQNEKTTIIYESPHRLTKLLIDLKNYCGGTREIQVSRELTKKFEEHIGNNINEVIDFFKDKEVLGEFTVVIKGKRKITLKDADINSEKLQKELHELVEAGLSHSEASKYLAKKEKLPKRQVYNLY